jgi:outer membrane receptor protein involved in Fe transport
VLVNAGRERFQGVETELRWHIAPSAQLTAAYSYHDARYGDTLTSGSGTLAQLSGYQLNLSPHDIGAVGVQLAGRAGLAFAAQAAYVGRRFLDSLNTAPVGGYLTLDARLALRLGQYTLALAGTNLSNRRDPVTASEFGDQSYYLLPARQLLLSVTADLARRSSPSQAD